MKHPVLLFVLFLVNVPVLIAQEAIIDTSYYQIYPEHITGRYYFSRKYTALKIKDKKREVDYLYMPNTTLNMGVGATYKNISLNLAYGFGFLNPDNGQGETKYLDAQAHIYPRKMVVDLFLQLYKGYYLLPEGLAAAEGENFLIRPDLKIQKLGASLQYVFNHGKFSYRAAFLQNEWQKKSAGTFLLGAEIYGGLAHEESNLVPAGLLDDPGRNFKTIRFFELGPNAGYAYTLVIKKHFFITASAAANLGLGYATYHGEAGRHTQWAVRPNYFLRSFAGYNSSTWSVNVNYVHNNVGLPEYGGFSSAMMTGNYRLNFVYRFLPGPRLKQKLRPVDRLLKR
ncbi:MAG TPA: DUF4421 domain-containing protein [Cyclobacteriaceae bacterium]|nr:DUF4421 domain-containing protein [Cyclobacteriaceae bacterium]